MRVPSQALAPGERPSQADFSYVTFSPGERIGQRYTIIKLLGRGGMGAVYQAWDDGLGLPVAIKTILPDHSSDAADRHLQEQRFKREILLARQVSHKNVVRIHDIGEISGTKYITMAFVEGETLGAHLRRVGRLSVVESLAIARQIADGLGAAHEAGIVHRDLKPENVMVTPDGVAIVMDFGTARLSEPTAAATTGSVVGTLAYMAPEQAAGQAVDARTDVYALGLVLYDMLLGRRRLQGRDSALRDLVARTTRPPPAPRSLDASIPDALDAVVMQCVQPDPAARFSSAREVAAALAALTPDGRSQSAGTAVPAPVPLRTRPTRRWMAAATALGALALAGAAAWMWRSSPSPVLEGAHAPVTVLVGDFQNAANDPTFDGLVEQALAVGIESSSFIAAFPRTDALRAVSRLTRTSLDEDTARLVAISEGVQVVVTGRLEARAGRYRLFARARTAGTNEKVLLEWTTEADDREDVLPAVGRVAAKLRNALGDTTVDEHNVREEETFTARSLEAARAYVEGQEMLAQGRQEDALASYRGAVELDPDLSRAWTRIGTVLANMGRRDEAFEAYRQALARIDRMTDREKFRMRSVYYGVSRNAQKALEESEALVRRFPSDGAGLNNLAIAHLQLRNFARAEEMGRAAAAIYPGSVLRQNNVALFALYAGRFEEAGAAARKALQLNATYPKALLGLGLSLTAQGHVDDGRSTYELLAKVPGGRTFAAHGLADLSLYRGRIADAIAALEPAIAAETSATARARLLLVMLEARLAQGNAATASKVLDAVRSASREPPALFEAGRLLAAAGRPAQASELATGLLNDPDNEAQALGAVLDAEVALASGDARRALARLSVVRALADSWLLRYAQGRAFLAAGRFAEADSEFDLCLRRRGEAVAVFLDDIPTWRVMAPVHYYQGVARAGLGSAGAADSFRTFLALKDGGDETGGLVADARKHLAAGQP